MQRRSEQSKLRAYSRDRYDGLPVRRSFGDGLEVRRTRCTTKSSLQLREQLTHSLSDAVQMRVGAVDQLIAGDRWRCGDAFAEFIRGEQFKLRPGVDHEGLTVVVAEIDVAVTSDR